MSNTITTAAPVPQTAQNNKASSNGSDAQSQVKALRQQIQDLTEKLSELKDSGLSKEEIQKQQQLITNQIKALYAEIARIQAKEAEKGKDDMLAIKKTHAQSNKPALTAVDNVSKARVGDGDGEGKNRAGNQINVYV
ncbi:FlxA-like family protein [Yersinia nurmii]|uniref:FlxA-like family protein n=1 Tax=Yersinia nurmii TaxID=685706 RepID=A0AAW7JY74_9GAMM|nr:FlxA-like family protein [Yersinia nurmii]MDN0087441.1 FlxA-like family protein [Yersinia nurmii]CNE08844.1 Uncharacterised protein [Yersinia nurmii]